MKRIRLVCRDAAMAKEHAALLERAGFAVDASEPVPTGFTKRLSEAATEAVVIDLDRQPSFGRELAGMVRNSGRTRHIPVVFAGGAAEKVERIRAELPDATFCTWRGVVGAVRRALRNPVLLPVKPAAHMERYAGTSLAVKLGVKADSTVAIVAGRAELAAGLEERLRETVPEATFVARVTRGVELAIFYVGSAAEIETAFERAESGMGADRSAWVLSPKQTGRSRADFNQNDVRVLGLRAGWVDYKVCSIDEDWSGLKFARRKLSTKRGR